MEVTLSFGRGSSTKVMRHKDRLSILLFETLLHNKGISYHDLYDFLLYDVVENHCYANVAELIIENMLFINLVPIRIGCIGTIIYLPLTSDVSYKLGDLVSSYEVSINLAGCWKLHYLRGII